MRDTTWDDVFAGWRAREANDPGWIHCATTLKGWPDWESWRQYTAAQLHLPTRRWQRFTCTNPLRELPAMRLGPYSGWQSRVPTPNTATFTDLIALPEQAAWAAAHGKIAGMMEHFPSPTELIGLLRDDGTVICVEGHHRATAVALAQQLGRTIHIGEVTLALAPFPDAERSLLDATLERGSEHPRA